QSGFGCARIVAHERLRQQLCLLERARGFGRVLRAVGEVSHETFKIAVLIALRNARPFEHAARTLPRATLAHNRHVARGVFARHHLPARSSAVGTILERHGDSIRAHDALSKPSAMWKAVQSVETSPCVLCLELRGEQSTARQ